MKNSAVLKVAFAVFFLCVFHVYLITAYPVYKADDSPETAACAYTLGVAHSPGYPLFSMLAKTAALVPAGSIVFRINILSAAMAAFISVFVFFLIRRELNRILKREAGVFSAAACVPLTAFSYVLWNQALCAKGGIYVLSLFFIVVMLGAAASMLRSYTPRMLYLAFFAGGLGFANHWPSASIAFVTLCAAVFFIRKEISGKSMLSAIVFLLIGITPYIYLPVRAGSDAVINWGNPVEFESFMWVVLRKGYDTGAATFLLSGNQFFNLKQFIVSNTPYVWPLAAVGAAALFFRSRRSFFVYGLFFLLFTASVVFYNPMNYSSTETGALWLFSTILLPSAFMLSLFVAAGIAWIASAAGRRAGQMFVILALCSAVIMIPKNFGRNDSSRDFIYYDYGSNLIKTINPGGFFLPDGDHDFFPLYYARYCGGRLGNISFFPVNFLVMPWGAEQFKEEFGPAVMVKGNIEVNTASAVERMLLKTEYVYRSRQSPVFEQRLPQYRPACPEGILFSIKKPCVVNAAVFEIYSYRGIHSAYAQRDENIDLFSRYPFSMYVAGYRLTADGRKEEARRLFEKSLAFRGIKNDAAAIAGLKAAGEGI